MKEKIKLFTGILIFLLSLIYGIFITISNPDMTEIRLLITYWKEYLAMFVLMLFGYYLIGSGTNRK